jgi:pimeloyl-ACP methyl ester carboxylesterase
VWEEDQPSGQGSVSNALVWSGSQWSAGANNQYPHASHNVSSFHVLDELIRYFDNREIFPQMTHIVLVGHSMGGQMLQRYAAVGEQLVTESRVVNWIGNPSSYIWPSTFRPMFIPDCPGYDDYREGYANFEEYGMTYGVYHILFCFGSLYSASIPIVYKFSISFKSGMTSVTKSCRSCFRTSRPSLLSYTTRI